MKILIADKFEKIGILGLQGLGAEVVCEPELKEASLRDRIKELEPDVLVVRSTKVTADMLEGSRLSVVIRAGAGYNTIDVEAANNYGIMVANCPGKNSQAVAELAFGLMLAADRRIPDNVIQLREGKWNKKEFSKARGLMGRTLGLIGMGKISQEMIQRAKAFGMVVIAHSRWMTPDVAAALGIGRAESLEELARQSDFVSVHVSLNPQTRGMLDKQFFGQMKEGAVFINTSRAEVVVQQDLLAALEARNLFAGLDVFDDEPSSGEGAYEGELCGNPRVYCTHHIGASTEQAQEAIADEVVRIVRDYKFSGQVANAVNVAKADSATHLLVVRHLDRVGVLAQVLAVLKDEGVNVQEMENVILGGARSAIAQLSLDKEVPANALMGLKMSECIFDATLFEMSK